MSLSLSPSSPQRCMCFSKETFLLFVIIVISILSSYMLCNFELFLQCEMKCAYQPFNHFLKDDHNDSCIRYWFFIRVFFFFLAQRIMINAMVCNINKVLIRILCFLHICTMSIKFNTSCVTGALNMVFSCCIHFVLQVLGALTCVFWQNVEHEVIVFFGLDEIAAPDVAKCFLEVVGWLLKKVKLKEVVVARVQTFNTRC